MLESVGGFGEAAHGHAGIGSGLTNVPALSIEYAGEEEGEQDGGANPAVCFVWGGFVEVGLVYLGAVIRQSRPHAVTYLDQNHTLVNLDVCALTAANGVSGSGASIMRVVQRRRAPCLLGVTSMSLGLSWPR